ncbi:MAG TPA: hypothetical protein VJ276_24880 [Thermoanaerobaculia bacterium]|nr:hypothetical protein [Thermoanaerobaculia bacterium]
MRRHRLLLLILFFAVPLRAGTILDLGDFHGKEVPARDGEEWLALTCSGDSCVVLPTRVRVEPFADMSDKHGQKSGRQVSVAMPAEDVVALLRDVPGVVSGSVRTVPESDMDGNAMKFDGERYELVVDEKDGAVSLRSGRRSQQIGEAGMVWTVQWAGDLDRDGKLDFIVSFDGDNVWGLELFLSSNARPGAMVHRAAVVNHFGC